MIKKNQIYKRYGTDYKEMTKQLLMDTDLQQLLPGVGCRIGIKPNLVSPSPASYGATTHPEVVAGIIEYLQEHGYDKITIMEGSWVGDKTSESYEVCGYDALVQQYGVEFCDAQKSPGHPVDCDGLTLNICDCVDQVDFLINVPVLKGHCQTKITCALKNMKGLIPNTEKRRFHSLGLHQPIAHLGRGIHQDFIVVDHICGDLDFEDGGNPVVRNCVMAALDPVLVDAYVCSLLHYKIEEVPYVKLAEQLGVGSADLTRCEILVGDGEGCSWDDEPADGLQQTGLKRYRAVGACLEQTEALPQERKIVELADAVEEVESCSACYGYLIPALDRLKTEGLLDALDTKICIGQGYQGQSGTLGIGRCTSGFTHSLKGCPPTEGQIYDFLKQYLEAQKNV
jgi:uncharacterized protein (DUF362 family)